MGQGRPSAPHLVRPSPPPPASGGLTPARPSNSSSPAPDLHARTGGGLWLRSDPPGFERPRPWRHASGVGLCNFGHWRPQKRNQEVPCAARRYHGVLIIQFFHKLAADTSGHRRFRAPLRALIREPPSPMASRRRRSTAHKT